MVSYGKKKKGEKNGGEFNRRKLTYAEMDMET